MVVPKSVGLGWLDVTLLVVSMLCSALIGLYFTNKNKSFDSYMLGDRKLSVLPVAISLMTSCMSGLTLLGSSAELYYQGPSYSFVFVAILLAGPISAYTILPVFYRMNELSLYRYLERRYGLLVKYFASGVFIIQMIFYNAVVLYLPAMALQSIVGLPKVYSVLVIGLLCVIYSAFGGIKAVVWTDLFQAILMYASLLTVGIMGTIDAGGFANVFKQAQIGERLDLDDFFELDLTTRHTLLGILFGSSLKHVVLIGINQVQIQRALSLPSLRQGQLSLVLCSIFSAAFTLLSTYMGLVMYSAYRSCDPYMAHKIPRRDAIVVHYVSTRLSRVPGLRGIFIAGLFSATLSTLSSFSNSMSALAIEDFIKPLRRALGRRKFRASVTNHHDRSGGGGGGCCNEIQAQNNTTDEEETRPWLAKLLAIMFGIICILIAYTIDKANSRLLQATSTLFGAIGVPFLAAFLMGIYTRFTNTIGLVTGLVVTLALGSYITLYQVFLMPPLQPKLPVYYDENCEQVFNMTMSSKLLPSIEELRAYQMIELKLPKVHEWFSVEKISYMILPFVQFVLTTLIATIVSLLTGGLKQQINDDCLAAFMHTEDTCQRDTFCSSIPSTTNGKLTPTLGEFITNDNQSQVMDSNKQTIWTHSRQKDKTK